MMNPEQGDAGAADATSSISQEQPLVPAPQQSDPARRETGPMGDRAKREDICAVCYQGEFSPWNNLLYCDGCDLGLHQHCYNIPNVPEGEDPYFCDYCSVANTYPAAQEEPPAVCALCSRRGGGLIRAMLLLLLPHEESGGGQGSPAAPGHSPRWEGVEVPPRFVHKTCALAGMGGDPAKDAPVRFVAGSNGSVALLSPTTLRAYETEDADRVGGARCAHCKSSYGLLLRCRGRAGEAGCSHVAHACCAFDASCAALVVDGSATPPVRVWCPCPEHVPPAEQANPGADAVAACLGLLPPPGPKPPSASEAGDAQEHQHQQQQRPIQPPSHFRGASALFAGYADDKAKLLLLAADAKKGQARGPRVLLVGRKGRADSAFGGGAVSVLYALKERARAFPPPQTPRAKAGDGGEAAAGGPQIDMDTSK